MSNPWADVKQGSLTSRYLYTRAVDEVFARLADDQQNGQLDLSWYLADRLGSVRQQVQTDGTILNEINYDSFGNIVTETNPAEGDRFKFTGREYDDLTGLYYYRARWYDAGTGKFLSEDPLGFASQDDNLYRYVINDPVNRTDPTGLDFIMVNRGVVYWVIGNRAHRHKGVALQGMTKIRIGTFDPKSRLIKLDQRFRRDVQGRYTPSVPLDILDRHLRQMKSIEEDPCQYHMMIIRNTIAEVARSNEVDAEFDFGLWMHYIFNFRFYHYNRNIYNQPPLTVDEAKKLGWKPMSDGQNIYHSNPWDREAVWYEKYLSPDGKREAVYDFKGRLVTDPRYMGTYNLYSPRGGVWSKFMHFYADILPYWLFGNTPDDQTPAADRLFGHGTGEWLWSIFCPEEWERLRGPNRPRHIP